MWPKQRSRVSQPQIVNGALAWQNKWCLVNKLSYCFNSCSLIKFTEGRVLHKGKEKRSNGSEEEAKKERRWTTGWDNFSLHHSIPRHLWLHWLKVSTLTIPINSQDCALLSIDSESSFGLSAKCNKVVLNRVGPGHEADCPPWHQVSDNNQETDLNFINSDTDSLSVA